MEQFIDVPVAEVAVGDEVKVDGYGQFIQDEKFKAVQLMGTCWVTVVDTDPIRVTIRDGGGKSTFRRSSITAARRRKTEPKPGDWRCFRWDGFTRTPVECLPTHHPKHEGREVYRAHGGWSPDMRTGRPRVMMLKEPVTVVVHAKVGSLSFPLHVASSLTVSGTPPFEGSWSDYYKRIGLDVRHVERRKL